MDLTCAERGRLDAFLAQACGGLSRVKAGALVRTGCVLVNGRIVRKPAQIVQPGDRVEVSLSEEPVSESHLTPVDLHLPILYEDGACLVIAKPAGVAVHPAPGMKKGEPTILHGIAHLFAERKIPFGASSVLVHRLDRETTGCLLIAKSPQAHAALQKEFSDRTVRKFYLAIVAGVPSHAAAVIDAPVGRNLTDRTKMSVLKTSVSREAKTTYQTLAAGMDCALLLCEIHTGRTHQVRVHLRSVGHPILGDPTYASSSSEKIATHYGIVGMCLHAWKLTFTPPGQLHEQTVIASLPKQFEEDLGRVGLVLP
ncbi:MAG: RluA family pseudouridine synthase [Candidatus Peribacteraceae bacterium]|nr:RluA family pseudouridine synthase [Candidatus Peribacteraceae bacterium]